MALKTQMVILAHIFIIIETILSYKVCLEKFGGDFIL